MAARLKLADPQTFNPRSCTSCRFAARRQAETITTVGDDVHLHCSDCGHAFVFTRDDQQFFAGKGWRRPGRCPHCREARRRGRAAIEAYHRAADKAIHP